LHRSTTLNSSRSHWVAVFSNSVLLLVGSVLLELVAEVIVEGVVGCVSTVGVARGLECIQAVTKGLFAGQSSWRALRVRCASPRLGLHACYGMAETSEVGQTGSDRVVLNYSDIPLRMPSLDRQDPQDVVPCFDGVHLWR
jgi:hypothetical protein